MRSGLLAAVILLLGVQTLPVSAAALGPVQIEASLPCPSGLQPEFSAQPSALGSRLCRAVAVAVLGIPLMSEAAAAALPEQTAAGEPGVQSMVQGIVTVLTRGGPRDIAFGYPADKAWAKQMHVAVANYRRVFHTSAGFDHLSLPPVPDMPWADPAT
jgi:hypothetical protein